jgi:hypothetical protein
VIAEFPVKDTHSIGACACWSNSGGANGLLKPNELNSEGASLKGVNCSTKVVWILQSNYASKDLLQDSRAIGIRLLYQELSMVEVVAVHLKRVRIEYGLQYIVL